MKSWSLISFRFFCSCAVYSLGCCWSCLPSDFTVTVFVVVAAHLQQEAQGQSGRKTQQTQVQSLQQTAARLTHCECLFTSLPLIEYYYLLLSSFCFFSIDVSLFPLLFSSPCLLRRSWWSLRSHLHSSPLLLLHHLLRSPPLYHSLHPLCPLPPSSHPSPPPSHLRSLSTLALRPLPPFSQPPSSVQHLDQSERAKDRFSSRRTDVSRSGKSYQQTLTSDMLFVATTGTWETSH